MCFPFHRMGDDAAPKVRRRQWDPQAMEAAMKAVKDGEKSECKQFGVLRKSLDDRVKGRVQHGTNPGPNTALTTEEESALEAYLLYMAERGFPLTTKMAQAFAWAIAFRSGTQGRFNESTGPGKHWWQNFKARHPSLRLRTADYLERSRASALNREVIDNYFACLKTILESNSQMGAPRQLFNCDETFLPLNFSCEKVIARKNVKHVYTQSRDTSEYITLLCGASAAGVDHIFYVISWGEHTGLMGRMMPYTQKVNPDASTANFFYRG